MDINKILEGLTPHELEDIIQTAILRKTFLQSIDNAQAIHREGCECYHCGQGESIPADKMPDALWAKFLDGKMDNETGLSSYLLVPERIELPKFAHLVRGAWEPGMTDFPFSEQHCSGRNLHEHATDIANGMVYCVTLGYRYPVFEFKQTYGKCYKPSCINHRVVYGYGVCDDFAQYWPTTDQRECEDSARIMAKATGSVGATHTINRSDGTTVSATYVRNP